MVGEKESDRPQRPEHPVEQKARRFKLSTVCSAKQCIYSAKQCICSFICSLHCGRYSCSGLFTIQIVPYIFLAQNHIELKHGLFKARSLNNLGQNLRLFTTPHSDAFTKLNERKKKLSESSQWVFVCFLSAPFMRNSISSLKYNFSLFLLSS